MRSGDGWVIFLLVLAFGGWLYAYVRMKLRMAVEQSPPLNDFEQEEVPDDEATTLLRAKGYRVLSGKVRYPIHVTANRQETLQSRLFIDYIAMKEGMYYAVKIAKDRKPLAQAGSAIRERLLIYQLLDRRISGVLYVDIRQGMVDRYEFDLEVAEE